MKLFTTNILISKTSRWVQCFYWKALAVVEYLINWNLQASSFISYPQQRTPGVSSAFSVYLTALQVFSSNLKFPLSRVVSRMKLDSDSWTTSCFPCSGEALTGSSWKQVTLNNNCVWNPRLGYLTPFPCLSFISTFTNRGVCIGIRVLSAKLKLWCKFSHLKNKTYPAETDFSQPKCGGSSVAYCACGWFFFLPFSNILALYENTFFCSRVSWFCLKINLAMVDDQASLENKKEDKLQGFLEEYI